MIYLTVVADVTITLTDVAADAVTAAVVSEITVVSGLFFCSSVVADVATASDTVATVVAEAVMTTVSGLFFCLSAVVDAAMALAAAKLPSILPVYTSDLMRGYLLLSPHIHSKTLSSGSVLWKNDRSFR